MLLVKRKQTKRRKTMPNIIESTIEIFKPPITRMLAQKVRTA